MQRADADFAAGDRVVPRAGADVAPRSDRVVPRAGADVAPSDRVPPRAGAEGAPSDSVDASLRAGTEAWSRDAVGALSRDAVDTSSSEVRHRAAGAIARGATGPRRAFVVSRGGEIVAILNAPASAARLVLERAAESLARTSEAKLLAGTGPPFASVTGFRASYDEARRAPRHATPLKPFVVGPDEVLPFDELTASVDQTIRELVPRETRKALTQPSLRSALGAFIAANQNVVEAADQPRIHPNTLRYRLSRITHLTGRDPRTLADLVERLAALRLVSDESIIPR